MKTTNGTLINVNIDKALILNALHQALDTTFKGEDIEVNDYLISLERKGELSFALEETKLHLDLPIQIGIRKPEGLFSIQGEGALSIKLNIDFEIDEDFNLRTSTTIKHHEWLEKPNLSMGMINIPVTSLLNLIINKFDVRIVKLMDEKLRQQLDLRSLVFQNLEVIKKGISIPSHPDVMVYVKPQTIHIQHLKDEEKTLKIGLLIVMNILLTDEENEIDLNHLQLSWTAIGTSSLNQEIFVSLSYRAISRMITNALDGMEVGGQSIRISETQIEHEANELKAIIHLTSPTQSTFTIIGTPHYSIEAGSFDLLDYNVEMKASNILYKLSSPIIEKVIESRVKEALPIKVNSLIKENLDAQIPNEIDIDLGKILVSYSDLHVDGISFEKNKLIGKATVIDPKLSLSLTGKDEDNSVT